MTKYTQHGSAAGGTDGTTGGIRDLLGFAGFPQQTTSVRVQQKAFAGTAEKISVGVSANTFTSTLTVTIVKNNTSGNNTITSSGNGQFTDTSHTDTIVGTDLINTLATGASGVAYSAVIIYQGLRMDHTSGYGSYWAVGSNGGVLSYATTTTSWINVSGGALNGLETTSEAAVQSMVRAAGTWDDLAFYSVSNTKAGTTTQVSRINSATGNQTITVTSLGTGLFEDTSHTDTVVTGDKLNYQLSTATAGTLTGIPRSRFMASGTLQDLIASDRRTANNGSNAIRFWSLYGALYNDAAEATVTTTTQWASSVVKLRQYVPTQATAGGWTLGLRISGVDGNLAIASGTGTGWTEDTSHTDTVTAGATLNYKTTASSNGTSLTSVIMVTQGATSSSETGTGIMSFGGVSFAGASNVRNNAVGLLTFSGVSFAATSSRNVNATGNLAFSGVGFTATSIQTEFGVGNLAFSGVSFDGHALRIGVTAHGNMSFNGVSFVAGAFIPTPAGTGLRQFWTT